MDYIYFVNDNSIMNKDIEIDNLAMCMLFGCIYAAIIIVLTIIYADYAVIGSVCDISNPANIVNGDLALTVAQCNKAKSDYIARDTNRYYTLLFMGIFSILLGWFISSSGSLSYFQSQSQSQSNENYKTIGRSLVFAGFILISFFIIFGKHIINESFKDYIIAFTLGLTSVTVFDWLIRIDTI